MPQIPTVTLNDGTGSPSSASAPTTCAERTASPRSSPRSRSGYRLLDTAVNYENEREVGEAVRRQRRRPRRAARDDEDPRPPPRVRRGDREHRGIARRLGLERIDLQLIHWPNPSVDKYVDTWRGMIDARERGLVRSIGVSNFTEAMLAELVERDRRHARGQPGRAAPVLPAGRAARLPRRARHPHRELEPAGPPQRAAAPSRCCIEIAEIHGVTPTQVVLRWHVELGSTPDPEVGGSRPPARERRRVRVLAHAPTQVAAISALERGRLWGGDPDTHEEM